MDLVTMLKKNPEQLPHWLRQPSSGFDRKSFFDGRTVYYPGFGNDGHPVSVCARAHAAHAFVYVDYGVSKETVSERVNGVGDPGFIGYSVEHEEEVSESDLRPVGWTPHLEQRELARVSYSFANVTPYGLFMVLKRNEDRDDSHGPERLAILFVGGDGHATYDALYCQDDGTHPPFLVVVQDHGFGGNFSAFGAGGLLERIARRCDVLPDRLLVGARGKQERFQPWSGYQDAGAESEPGGEVGNPRRLFRREEATVNCWAMRTSRDSEEHRKFLNDALRNGLLRQGWGWDKSQDLRDLEALWANDGELSDIQKQAGRHRRMGNGQGDAYMQAGDLVAIPNMPNDGLFTIARITGDYYFEIPEAIGDFGHVRPVEVLTPMGVSNHNRLVHAGLRRSFRALSRMWNIRSYCESLDSILQSGLAPEELMIGSTPVERVDTVVADLITEPLNLMADRLASALPERVRAEEWEPVLREALESLFPVSVLRTGGRNEHGADIEIVISNPFEENRDWIVAVQVKDYEGKVGAEVADQLVDAYESRSQYYQVIAVVLLVSNADASEALDARMRELSERFRVPFVFCGRDLFLRLLARGFLRRS